VKFFRSVAGVLVGALVFFFVTAAVETISFLIHRPDDGKTMMEQMKDMKENPKAAKAWIETRPASALILVLAAVQAGAFLGGATSALIAGRMCLLHAGIIGALALAGTVMNAHNMKQEYDFTHPTWMIIAGLLLPLPLSLLGGKLVSPRTSPPTPVSNP
jgi:hypothetical protein